ncbi:MAG: T9SS type A sorting domain-containing protein [Lentimicrobium sp.]|nr:T9SS type A sorting domain-containing protein [Lentimicrobium sp.]
MKRLLLFSMLSLFCLTISAQTNTWISSNGDWSTASKWSLNVVPTSNHDVVIPAGAIVNLDIDGFSKSITLQGNAIFNFTDNSGHDLTFTNASSFSAGSTFNWLYGTMKGGGTLTLNGTTVLTGFQHKFVQENTTINNNGTIFYQGTGRFYLVDGTLNNGPNGVIDLQTASGNIDYSAGPGAHVFTNQGLLKRSGTGEVWVTAEFHNNGGTISVEGGNLVFNYLPKYLNNGTYNVSPGSELTFNITATDSETILSGTLTGVLNGDLKWLGKFSVPNSATFNFTGNNGINWSDGGTLMSGGTLTNLSNMKLTGDGSKFINDQSTFNNEGTILFQGTGEFIIDYGTLNNLTSGIIDIQSTYADFTYGNGATHIIHNYGLIKNTIATGTQRIRVELQNHNGTISVENGTLYLSGLSKYLTDGTYNVASDAVLRWNTEIICAGTLTGALTGEIVVSTASINIPENTTASFNFTGNKGIILDYVDAIKGAGTLVNIGKMTFSGDANKFITENTTLRNEGIINNDGIGNTYLSDGTLINAANGMIDLQSAGGDINEGTGDVHNFINSGIVKRSITAGKVTISVATTNSGIIDVQTGELEFSGSLGFHNTSDGVVMGTGTLILPSSAPAFTNDGIFSPGGNPGALTVTGNFKSSPTSKLQSEIFGKNQGTEYDLLNILGNAIMNGTLEVGLNYAAEVNDEFVILTANDISSCNLPASVTAHYDNHNYTFDVMCNPDNVTLKVSSIILGTEENPLSNLSLYPNPTKGNFAVDLGKEYPDVTIQIYNMTGQVVSLEKYASARIIENQLNNFPGIYFVKVSTASGESTTLKMIKQ